MAKASKSKSKARPGIVPVPARKAPASAPAFVANYYVSAPAAAAPIAAPAAGPVSFKLSHGQLFTIGTVLVGIGLFMFGSIRTAPATAPAVAPIVAPAPIVPPAIHTLPAGATMRQVAPGILAIETPAAAPVPAKAPAAAAAAVKARPRPAAPAPIVRLVHSCGCGA